MIFNTGALLCLGIWIFLFLFILFLFIKKPQQPIMLRNIGNNKILCTILLLIAITGFIFPFGTLLWTWMIAPPLILLILPFYKYKKYKKMISLKDGLLLCIFFSIPWMILLKTDHPSGENWGVVLYPFFIMVNFAAFLLPKIIILFFKWFKKFIGDFK